MYNSKTQLCRKTALGPSFVDDIHFLSLLNDGNESKYLCFASHERVVGVTKLPLDGNPHKSMGLIAHPKKISNIVASSDGLFLFTAGGKDNTVYMWSINTNVLESQILSAGEGISPFLHLLDDSGLGEKGPAYRELEDYFYYAQLKR